MLDQYGSVLCVACASSMRLATIEPSEAGTSMVMFDKSSLQASLAAIETFSKIEGLDAHGRSAAIRLKGGASSPQKKTKRAKK